MLWRNVARTGRSPSGGIASTGRCFRDITLTGRRFRELSHELVAHFAEVLLQLVSWFAEVSLKLVGRFAEV